MKLRTVLSKLNNIVRYLRRRKKVKLYQQWVSRDDLAPDAVPPEEIAEYIIPRKDKEQSRLRILYILLTIALVILGVGLILLIIHSC